MRLRYLLAAVLLHFSLHCAADGHAYISIIIDDMGYRTQDDKRAITLPGHITYAIMPFSPNAGKISESLQKSGKDVLLHMPMQPLEQKQNRFLGPGALTVDMDKPRFISTVNNAIKSIPAAVGMNNHMGSLLSQRHEHMQWLMEALQQHKLMYVDSVTVKRSQAKAAAKQYQVPYLRRDVFLDNRLEIDYIRAQFKQLIETAKRKGTALAIGHPRPETLKVLEQELQKLDHYSVKLVKLDELLQYRKQLKLVNSK